MNVRTADIFPNDVVGHVNEPSPRRLDGVMGTLKGIATLSEALRILGAAVILASMSLFLLQGWNDGNDINRYLLLLAQTGLLGAAGFALSHGLKEAKGARIFFGLALISIPANFTILGALLYSVFQLDGALTTYPGYATWQIGDVANIGLTLGGALLVLVPMSLFCFAIMARHSAKALALHFMLLNALLLIPVRESMVAGAVALVGTVYAVYMISRMLSLDRALKTGEGKFALTALFVPIGIILFRSMYFYEIDSLMIAMLSLAVFLAARQASLFPGRKPRVGLALEAASLPIALVTALAVVDGFAPSIAWALQAPLFAVVYTLMALDVLRRTSSERLAKAVGLTISLFVSMSFAVSVANSPTGVTALLSLVAGGMLATAGILFRDKTAITAGSLTVLAGIVFGFDPFWQLVVTSSWITLATVGATAIAMGSLLDRHGVSLKLKAEKWFEGVGERREAIELDE